ncbi:MAG: hypothetical protein NTZ59_14615 [Bacteroidetes bacterium]|nr:hypothetical protein [Bacteroidota bacterium]
MKYLFSIFFLLILKVSYCTNSNDTFQKRDNKKISNEKLEVKSAAIKMLKWFFNVHSKTQRTFKKFYIKGEEGDSTNPYRIDFEGVQEYFDYLKKTNLFSQKFTEDLLVYFKKCDSNFIAVKQFEKIPLGFESSIITKDLDPMGVEKNINKSVISSYKKVGNTVYLSLKFDNFYTYTFIITRYNGKWLIDNINGDFPPLYSTPI